MTDLVEDTQSSNYVLTWSWWTYNQLPRLTTSLLEAGVYSSFWKLSAVEVKVESRWSFLILTLWCYTSNSRKMRYCWSRQQMFGSTAPQSRPLFIARHFSVRKSDWKRYCWTFTSSTTILPHTSTQASCHFWLKSCMFSQQVTICETIVSDDFAAPWVWPGTRGNTALTLLYNDRNCLPCGIRSFSVLRRATRKQCRKEKPDQGFKKENILGKNKRANNGK